MLANLNDFVNDIDVFDSTIKDLLNNVDQYINLPETDKWDDHFIKDIDIDYVLERGQKKVNYIFIYYLKLNIIQKYNWIMIKLKIK